MPDLTGEQLATHNRLRADAGHDDAMKTEALQLNF